jgi:hypothetical protein
MGQKLDIFKVWPPDLAQKNINHILNLFKNINELISLIIFCQNTDFWKKTCFGSKSAHEFTFSFDPKYQNTSMILSFWKGLWA